MDVIQSGTTVQFVLVVVALITGVMVLLQAAVNKSVWWGYLGPFLLSLAGLAAALRFGW